MLSYQVYLSHMLLADISEGLYRLVYHRYRIRALEVFTGIHRPLILL